MWKLKSRNKERVVQGNFFFVLFFLHLLLPGIDGGEITNESILGV